MEQISKVDQLKLLDIYIESIQNNKEIPLELHESDIADLLSDIKKSDEGKFDAYLTALPPEVLGETLLELPEKYQAEISCELSAGDLAEVINELDTDDATDVIQRIEEVDAKKAEEVVGLLDEGHGENVKSLRRYDEDHAGSYMQVELFSAELNEVIGESLKRFKQLKDEDLVENIQYVFIVDDENRLVGLISLEDLIICDFSKTYGDLREQIIEPIYVFSNDNVQDVSNLVEKYDLSVVPVVDSFKHLLGRITPDDMYDIIEESATDQIYSLANVKADEELEDSVFETGRSRGYWLFVNLLTAIMASLVIGSFAETIDQIVALAVLMPIVASMGGIAGTQTLTVVVRQMALGEVDSNNAREIVKKELMVALMNGMIFAAIGTAVAYFWFAMPMLGFVMGLALLINLMFAGLFGAGIPLFIKKMGVDPAIASGVLLTTVTDVVGFFTFLGLATLILFK